MEASSSIEAGAGEADGMTDGEAVGEEEAGVEEDGEEEAGEEEEDDGEAVADGGGVVAADGGVAVGVAAGTGKMAAVMREKMVNCADCSCLNVICYSFFVESNSSMVFVYIINMS